MSRRSSARSLTIWRSARRSPTPAWPPGSGGACPCPRAPRAARRGAAPRRRSPGRPARPARRATTPRRRCGRAPACRSRAASTRASTAAVIASRESSIAPSSDSSASRLCGGIRPALRPGRTTSTRLDHASPSPPADSSPAASSHPGPVGWKWTTPGILCELPGDEGPARPQGCGHPRRATVWSDACDHAPDPSGPRGGPTARNDPPRNRGGSLPRLGAAASARDDLDGHRDPDVGVQRDLHLGRTHRLERLGQRDLAAIDLDAGRRPRPRRRCRPR